MKEYSILRRFCISQPIGNVQHLDRREGKRFTVDFSKKKLGEK